MDFEYLANREEAVPIVAEWYFEQWGTATEDSVEQTRLKLRKYLNWNHIPLMVLALDEEEVVGAAQLKYYEMDVYPDKEHWLGGVYVPSAHRGKGVATLLVEKVTEIAQSLGVSTLYLQTERLDGGLYSSLGWESSEQVKYKGRDVLVMEKHLGV